MENSDLILLYKGVLDSDLEMADKKELLDEIRKLQPATDNRHNFRNAMLALIFVAAIGPLAYGITFAIAAGTGNTVSMPQALIALSSTAVGALAAYMTGALRK